LQLPTATFTNLY